MRGVFYSVARVASLTFAACLALPGSAYAHVKWFCAFDVAGQPVGLENVLCPDFELLMTIAIAGLSFGALVEFSGIGPFFSRALDRITEWPRAQSEQILAFVCASFFIAAAVTGGFLLTPELKTTSPFIPWLQVAIAAGFAWPQGRPYAAAGIVALFAISVGQYGVFHLMDYPIFLGIAAYFILNALQLRPLGLSPLDVVRWSAAITLMWASIEKWAYPQWTFPLFVVHPGMAMGFDPDFYMRAAGMVEFALAFALLRTPLTRRVASLVLIGMFLAAIPVFGKIDAIGHSAIIAVLVVIAVESAPERATVRTIAWTPVALCGFLAVFLFSYYELHALLFKTSII